MLFSMSAESYIDRTLLLDGRPITETDLLDLNATIIVLAEPGAGKTELLKSLARQTGTRRYRASLLSLRHDLPAGDTIILDGLDEVARGGALATDQLIQRAAETGAKRAIFASRSGEWEASSTRSVKECFGDDVKTVRLCPFEEPEQRLIFEKHLPGESFAAFHREVARFELTPLMGNPEFIKLFADAYIENGRRFETKRKIFFDAVRRLASESNLDIASRDRPPIDKIIALAGELFAKLLLSGAIGVSVAENIGDATIFPHLASMLAAEARTLAYLVDTRLFKPDESEGLHEPVHRIVAEFCAANYLVKRIEGSQDGLSLKRCLAVLAPNSVVRTELRGLLGWMASLGGPAIQAAAIALDPYAVLANGDPSQLSAISKPLLVETLDRLAKTDPFFRQSDFGRSFSMAGFFNADTVDLVRSILGTPDDGSHLHSLMLELLAGSSAAMLVAELRHMMLTASTERDHRTLAYRALASISHYDPIEDFSLLVSEAEAAALDIAVEMVLVHGVATLGRDRVLALLRSLAVYRNRPSRRRDFDAMWLYRELFGSFRAGEASWYLDNLTHDMRCVCGDDGRQFCRCRIGLSKVCGQLIDRYFETSSEPHDATRLWGWISPLFFENARSGRDSAAILHLKANDALRQDLQKIAIGTLRTPDEIMEIHHTVLGQHVHAGLIMLPADYPAMANHAVATKNIALWSTLLPWPTTGHEHSWRWELRAEMRRQAAVDPALLRSWFDERRRWQRWRNVEKRGLKRRREKKQEGVIEANRAFSRRNAEAIVAGQFPYHLFTLADYYLRYPDDMAELAAEPDLAQRALRAFVARCDAAPTLADLVAGENLRLARICTAATLLWFREHGQLDGLERDLLKAVKIDLTNYTYPEGESEAFEQEIDRQLFSCDSQIEQFLRDFIEPQFQRAEFDHTNVNWLEYKPAFRRLRGKLSLDWLRRFPVMPFAARHALFQIAVKYGDLRELRDLIASRSGPLLDMAAAGTLDPQSGEAQFWLIRHLFFLGNACDRVIAAFGASPDGLLTIEARAGRLNRDEAVGWPRLGARKTALILDRYIDDWPKVDLPGSYGNSSPPGETAYRFLCDLIWSIGNDDPGEAIPVLEELLDDIRFSDFTQTLKHLSSTSARRRSLESFAVPTPRSLVDLLDRNQIATVEDLRSLMLDMLGDLQGWVRHAPTNPIRTFYREGRHVEENHATERIVDRLEGELNRRGITAVLEHRMADENRCDFTASCVIAGDPRLLVVEVKGQWNSELYTAAAEQLSIRYASHPHAAWQGIYLVLWYGSSVEVARRQNPFRTPDELHEALVNHMPEALRPLIDVFILDLSR